VFLWPGFLITNHVYSLLGYQGIGSENFSWILWPAVVINAVLYAGVYVLSCEVVTRRRKREIQS